MDSTSRELVLLHLRSLAWSDIDGTSLMSKAGCLLLGIQRGKRLMKLCTHSKVVNIGLGFTECSRSLGAQSSALER